MKWVLCVLFCCLLSIHAEEPSLKLYLNMQDGSQLEVPRPEKIPFVADLGTFEVEFGKIKEYQHDKGMDHGELRLKNGSNLSGRLDISFARKHVPEGTDLTGLQSFQLNPRPKPLPRSEQLKSLQKEIQTYIDDKKITTTADNWRTKLPIFPELDFSRTPAPIYWVLNTSEGEIIFRLRQDAAPKHVANLLYLTQLGFYEDLTFHRIIDSFMAQGGCPLGTGTGQPGYKFGDEDQEVIKHEKFGDLAMANAGPGTDGCQFYITFGPLPHLDGRHTVFGHLERGEATVKRLEQLGPGGAAREVGKPAKPVTILKARVASQLPKE